MHIHRFKIPVNCRMFSCESANGAQDSEEIYYDNGMIAFPESYSDGGEATRLIISCHGAGGTVSTDDSQIESQIMTKYFLANGYAVMDVNGLPDEYSKKTGIDIRNNIGSPIAVQSYVKAYHYCMDRFNLKREVFVHGGSMGGISSTNLVLSGCIPVIAQTGFCPVLDTYNQIFLHPWTNGAPKFALEKIYGLAKDGSGAPIYDESKVAGYNPMGRLLRIGDAEYLNYPVPVKFWQCENDHVVSIECTKRFIGAIRNAGGIAYLRTFALGGHEPQLCGEAVQNPCGVTVFEGNSFSVTPAIEEVLLWIRRFD